jgi:hypothetical protein
VSGVSAAAGQKNGRSNRKRNSSMKFHIKRFGGRRHDAQLIFAKIVKTSFRKRQKN